MSEVEVNEEVKVKRPTKQLTLAKLEAHYTILSAGLLPVEEIAKAIKKDNLYLYSKEIEEVITKRATDSDFNPELFVKMLSAADAIREGSQPAFGGVRPTGGGAEIRIDSVERATQVANNPANEAEVATIVSIMKELIALREKIKPLINQNATLSLALKNNKVVADEKASETTEVVVE